MLCGASLSTPYLAGVERKAFPFQNIEEHEKCCGISNTYRAPATAIGRSTGQGLPLGQSPPAYALQKPCSWRSTVGVKRSRRVANMSSCDHAAFRTTPRCDMRSAGDRRLRSIAVERRSRSALPAEAS
jgi:hypothetical protein